LQERFRFRHFAALEQHETQLSQRVHVPGLQRERLAQLGCRRFIIRGSASGYAGEIVGFGQPGKAH